MKIGKSSLYLGREPLYTIYAAINPSAITVTQFDGYNAVLTYDEPLLRNALRMEAEQIAGAAGILSADNDKTETVMTVSLAPNGGISSVRLHISVKPYRYSEQEKAEWLERINPVDSEKREELEMMFDLAESYYTNKQVAKWLELEDVLTVELTRDEKRILRNLLSQHAAA